MNEELEQKALVALDGIIQTVAQTQEFVVEQAPEVIQQLLTWHLVENLIWGVLSIFTLVIILICWGAIIKFWDIIYKKDLEWVLFPMFILTFLQFVVSIGGIISFMDAGKILVAPKLYLIEYAANLF
jgi:hypothetical protein